MKILFLSHYSGLLGSNRSLDSIITYFTQKGINISILLPSKGEFYNYLRAKGMDVHSFMFIYETLYVKKNKKYFTLPILWLYNIVAFPFLLWKIRKLNPDVIYTNSSSDLYSVFLSKILRKKHVMHVREFMQEDFGGYCILGRNVKREIILKSDKLVFVSHAVANAVVGEIPQYGRIIYNGLPTPLKNYDYHDIDEKFRIGVVANIDISKQQDLAIKMMPDILKKYPKVTLHLIGDKDCPYKRYLKELVKQLELESKVIFEGFVKDTEEIYSKFDILLMCSRSEAFGRVTIESMLRYKPVIGYEAGGTPELIKDGITGFKFKTEADVIRALNIIINDSEKTKKIVYNAHKEASEEFAEKVYTNKVYDFIINEKWREY